MNTCFTCSCFSHAVECVTFSNMPKETSMAKKTFECLLIPSLSHDEDRTIMVTDTMTLLYKEVTKEKPDKFVCLIGPPGVGKTTALYWLYRQLRHSGVEVEAIPYSSDGFSSISDKPNLLS